MNIFSMWKNTRMVVLVAVTAALYVAILLPFKAFTLVPGFTEVRPGAAIPVVCSILFGPAAAWGSAIGNLIGDIYGNMLTPGSIAGFVGNFLYGLIPFLFWRMIVRGKSGLAAKKIAAFIIGCVISSAVCAVVIAIGVKYLAGAPNDTVKFLLSVIFVNNTGMSIIFGSILLLTLYPAVSALGLTFDKLQETKRVEESDLELEDTALAPADNLRGSAVAGSFVGVVLLVTGLWGWQHFHLALVNLDKLIHKAIGDPNTLLETSHQLRMYYLGSLAIAVVGGLILLASALHLWFKSSKR